MGGWGEISKSKAAAAGGPRKATQFFSSAEKRSVCVFRRCCSFRLSPSAFLYAESRPAAAARFYRLCCVARRGEGREEKIGAFFSFRHLAERERGSHCSFVKEKLPSKRSPKKVQPSFRPLSGRDLPPKVLETVPCLSHRGYFNPPPLEKGHYTGEMDTPSLLLPIPTNLSWWPKKPRWEEVKGGR